MIDIWFIGKIITGITIAYYCYQRHIEYREYRENVKLLERKTIKLLELVDAIIEISKKDRECIKKEDIQSLEKELRQIKDKMDSE